MGKAKRRWDGRREISGVKEDGGRGLEVRTGEWGGVRQGKAVIAVREVRRERGSWEPAKPCRVFVQHLARPQTVC